MQGCSNGDGRRARSERRRWAGPDRSGGNRKHTGSGQQRRARGVRGQWAEAHTMEEAQGQSGCARRDRSVGWLGWTIESRR
jgi:hypothetical protein